ncbi:MAG: 4Fe-4S binding protein [Thermoflexales bacterium]|nr:4Fe-4S binding protein [Thermoflexales bacterium]
MTYKIIVNVQKCSADGECVDICPSQMFELQEVDGKKVAVFSGDPEDCTGCESCVDVCPEEALTLTEI